MPHPTPVLVHEATTLSLFVTVWILYNPATVSDFACSSLVPQGQLRLPGVQALRIASKDCKDGKMADLGI